VAASPFPKCPSQHFANRRVIVEIPHDHEKVSGAAAALAQLLVEEEQKKALAKTTQV
jgi:hypothetical protein